jgi:heat shock protein HspQ
VKVGDLVRHDQGFTGIITRIDPEEIGDDCEVEVAWNDGDVCNMSIFYVRELEVISESR